MLKNKKAFFDYSHCKLELLRKSHYLLTDPRTLRRELLKSRPTTYHVLVTVREFV